MNAAPEPTSARLFSPPQIAIASFIGAPIAASWFFSRNYRQLGDSGRATMALVWGVLGTLVALVIATFLPDWFPNIVFPLAYSLGLRAMAQNIHGNAVAQHVSSGGKLGSWWVVVGISTLMLLVIVAIALVFFTLFPGIQV
jgi:hypothetical protein